jgi:hypothetical protein
MIFLFGSLTQLQGEGLQGYSNAAIRYSRKIEGKFHGTTAIPFIPPPMGGCGNPNLVRAISDGCCWLAKMPGYSLQKSMGLISEEIQKGAGGGEGDPLCPLRLAHLPAPHL